MDPFANYPYGDDYEQIDPYQGYSAGYPPFANGSYPANAISYSGRGMNPTQRQNALRGVAAARSLAPMRARRFQAAAAAPPQNYQPPFPPAPPFQQDPIAAREADPVVIEARKTITYSQRQLAYYQNAYNQATITDNAPDMTKTADRIRKHRDIIKNCQQAIDEWQMPNPMMPAYMQAAPPFTGALPYGQPPQPPIVYSGKISSLTLLPAIPPIHSAQ